MRVIALGRTEILYETICRAHEAGHKIVAVATCPAAPEYEKRESDFEALAKKLNVPFVLTESLRTKDAAEFFAKAKPDIGVSVNWKTLVPKSIIDAARLGILNAHAGDLPRYRGNAVANWSIINGEKEVTLAIHQMVPELDAGPVVLKERYALTPTTRIGEVFAWIQVVTPALFLKAIDGLQNGSIRPQPQDDGSVLRCYPRLPRDSEIHWDQSAEQIVRIVRASSEPFSGAYTHLDGEKLVVWRARVEPVPHAFLGTPGQVAELRRKAGEVAVLARDAFVVLEEVELKSVRGNPLQFITTARARLGLDYAAELESLRKRIKELESRLEESKGKRS